MPSPKLNNIIDRYPKLRDKLTALVDFISQQVAAGRMEIVPAIAAQSLKISEAEVLGYLMLFQREGLLHPIYQVYCKNKRALLSEVESPRQIAESIDCQYCGEDHSNPDELEVELIFRVEEKAWENLTHNVAVS
jgi:hypothetical protein